MKKLSFLLVITLLVAFTSKAQNSLIATLSHQGHVQMFYGSKALTKAHEAATTGDVITLSSGTFEACNITKAVKIIGAGMAATAQGGNTVLNGSFQIQVDDSDNICTLEGVWSNQTIYYYKANLEIIKCAFFGSFVYSGAGYKEVRFIQSKIGHLSISGGSTAAFYNCDVAFYTKYTTYDLTGLVEVTNCVVRTNSGDFQINELRPISLYNCIICSNYDSGSNCLTSSCNVLNCIAVGPGAQYMFRNIPNQTNTVVNGGFEEVFKTYRGTWVESEMYELTDEAAATYLGSDGTQVGMYGGILPFDPVPSNPQITKCNVASKSSLDGKLSVDIEVSVAK